MFFVIALPILWLFGVFIIRKHRVFAIALLAMGIVFLLFLCLPGLDADKSKLREEYVNSLERYEGTRYIWGGENRLGIDCSGLVRNGLINANVRVGILSLNPKPIRQAFELWWNDCSARALLDGYRQFTTPLFKAESINSITNSFLAPGDIAITSDGSHVLAYLGNSRWIEADPEVMKTIVVVSTSDRIWFNIPVHVRRWTQLIGVIKD
jgi:cell wall-associated NlpC family hydrolase